MSSPRRHQPISETLSQTARAYVARNFGRVQLPHRLVLDSLPDGGYLPRLELVSPATAPAAPRKRPRHSDDFRSVSTGAGTVYRFSPTQAAIVKALWDAREAGTPDVGQARLLEAADSTADRLRDLFRGHDAWGVLVMAGGSKGTFRLRFPGDDEHAAAG